MSERTKEIGQMIAEEMFRRSYYSVEVQTDTAAGILDCLPEFQETKWIKCIDGIPKGDDPIWYWHPSLHKPFEGFGRYEMLHSLSNYYWMPRQVPKPPVEEESEQVREISKYQEENRGYIGPNGLAAILDIVKRYESKNGKA